MPCDRTGPKRAYVKLREIDRGQTRSKKDFSPITQPPDNQNRDVVELRGAVGKASRLGKHRTGEFAGRKPAVHGDFGKDVLGAKLRLVGVLHVTKPVGRQKEAVAHGKEQFVVVKIQAFDDTECWIGR